MSEETILQEAQRLVHGDRGVDYGHPLDDFNRTAAIWTAILGDKLKSGMKIEPEEVGLCMVVGELRPRARKEAPRTV